MAPATACPPPVAIPCTPVTRALTTVGVPSHCTTGLNLANMGGRKASVCEGFGSLSLLSPEGDPSNKSLAAQGRKTSTYDGFAGLNVSSSEITSPTASDGMGFGGNSIQDRQPSKTLTFTSGTTASTSSSGLKGMVASQRHACARYGHHQHHIPSLSQL